MPTDISHVSLRQLEAMRSGARVAVRSCMNVRPGNRVFVITDKLTHGIGRLLGSAALIRPKPAHPGIPHFTWT